MGVLRVGCAVEPAWGAACLCQGLLPCFKGSHGPRAWKCCPPGTLARDDLSTALGLSLLPAACSPGPFLPLSFPVCRSVTRQE